MWRPRIATHTLAQYIDELMPLDGSTIDEGELQYPRHLANELHQAT